MSETVASETAMADAGKGSPDAAPWRGMHDPAATEADTLRRNAALHGDHTATIFRGRTQTYATLDRHASQVANGLLASGIGRRHRVGFLGKNSDRFFELLYGTAKADMVLLPVNWRLAGPEIAFVLNDGEAEILFADAEYLPLIEQIRAETGIKRVIRIDPMADADEFTRWRDEFPAEDPALPVDPEATLLQLYTSGTTGLPKGAEVSHRASRAMRRLEQPDADWARWTHEDVAIVHLPNFHNSGTSWAMMWFARGCTCVILPQMDAREVLHAIQDHRVTLTMLVPTTIEMLLNEPDFGDFDLSSLKLIFYGAAPISQPLLKRMAVFGCQYCQIYGMTETNGCVTFLPPDQHFFGNEEIMGSVGRPLVGLDVKIMDADGNPVAPGVVGEICIHTPAVMTGYWKRPEANAGSRFGPYHRSGDAGYLNEGGYLYLVDRLKDMIISGGENIYPAELERVLIEHPQVREVAVIGVPNDHWGEEVKAIVVPTDDSLDEDSLRAFIKDKVARYKQPKSYVLVEALPRNAAGKVLKVALRRTYGR